MRWKSGRMLVWLVPALAVLGLWCASAIAAKAPPPSKPSASTGAATGVTPTSATLYADVNPEGQSTTFYFEIGTTTALGMDTTLQSAGAGTTATQVGTQVTGLTPNATYYYRVLASNATGQALGAVKHFKTPKIPLSVSITSVTSPVPYGGTGQVLGTLGGTEAPNHEVILEANPFPYTAGFQQIGSPVVTSPTGAFLFTYAGVRSNSQLRVVTVGGSVVASSIVEEEVSVGVTLHARRTRRRGYVRLYGSVTPSEPGAVVGFQLTRHGGPWVSKGGTVVKGGGSHFSRVVKVRHGGVYRALVEVRGENTSGYSNTIRLR